MPRSGCPHYGGRRAYRKSTRQGSRYRGDYAAHGMAGVVTSSDQMLPQFGWQQVADRWTFAPVVLPAYAATIVGTHLTSVGSRVMSNEAAHNGEPALYLLVGYLFFLPLLGREPIRWRLSYPMRLAALIVIMPVDTFTGVVLGF